MANHSDSAPTLQVDVLIIGGGLAGLSLARHLLLDTDKSILLLERRDQLPPKRQKVGESTVQVAGYYFSRVLDLEEYLLCHHFMKYNLRFYWPSAERSNDAFEDYSQAYIRPFSNVASYQLDRNTFEAELLARNEVDDRFSWQASAKIDTIDLAEDGGQHQVTYKVNGETRCASASWVIDTSGRGRVMAKRQKLTRTNSIQHGSFFWWVDGLVDIEKLTAQSRTEVRRHRRRRQTGHLPLWMATNHFMGEGFWFWVIPLQGKTSLGLVFDTELIDPSDVFSVEKATAWVCERFPLFLRDLPQREVLDFGGYRSFSHDCAQTIDTNRRWAMTGEAGRFTDPLYSPGSDLIAIYNTLIVDAIRDDTGQANDQQLAAKGALYEQLMRSAYAAYVPSYATSYDALGDAEAFVLKYTWELTIYFAFYVFPFINDLLTDRRFAIGFLRTFSKLGPLNRGVQHLLSGYFQWKQEHRQPLAEPVCHDFTDLEPLRAAERTFYLVDLDAGDAKKVLTDQLDSITELARFIAAHVGAQVLDEPKLVVDAGFVEALDVEHLRFDLAAFAEARQQANGRVYSWDLDPFAVDALLGESIQADSANAATLLEKAS